MSKHYLTCSNENCERTECVGRRELEHKIYRLERENASLQEEVAALREAIDGKVGSNAQIEAIHEADNIAKQRGEG